MKVGQHRQLLLDLHYFLMRDSEPLNCEPRDHPKFIRKNKARDDMRNALRKVDDAMRAFDAAEGEAW